MSGVIQWALTLISAVVAWHMRKRNLGLMIASLSLGGLVAMSMGDFAIEGRQIEGFAEFVSVSVKGGLPTFETRVAAWLLMVGFTAGLTLAIVIYRREAKEAQAKRVAVVELRGLVDTSDTPLIAAIPASIVGRREDCRVDVRSMVSTNELNVPAAIEELSHVPRNLRQRRADTARSDYRVVAGGVMQVPLLFYTGVLLDDEGAVTLMDWDRTKTKWRELNEVDSGVRFELDGLESIERGAPVVLAVSASYMAELADIAGTFPGIPLVHLHRNRPANSPS